MLKANLVFWLIYLLFFSIVKFSFFVCFDFVFSVLKHLVLLLPCRYSDERFLKVSEIKVCFQLRTFTNINAASDVYCVIC